MKPCIHCGIPKILDEFYRHPEMADGRLNSCKECHKARVSENKALNREYYSAHAKQYYQQPETKAAAIRWGRTYRIANPEKRKARVAVSNALRDRRLVKGPCQHCGATDKVQAHHHDYSKPLDVEWLCFKCHREREHGQVVVAA